MRTFKNTIIPKEYRGSAIAIGNFDGVHRGHQKVFKQAKKYAKKNKIKFGVLTFTPLPVMFFNRNIKNCRLISENTKFRLLARYGVDFVINIKFDKIFSRITAEKFISSIIYEKVLYLSCISSLVFVFYWSNGIWCIGKTCLYL